MADKDKLYKLKLSPDYYPVAMLWCVLCCRKFYSPITATLYEDDTYFNNVCHECYGSMKESFDAFRVVLTSRVESMRKQAEVEERDYILAEILRRNAQRIEYLLGQIIVLPTLDDELRVKEEWHTKGSNENLSEMSG